MASSNKKTFAYSSSRMRDICERLLKDRSDVEKTTASVLIEDAILHYLLPQHRDAAKWVELLYDDESLAHAYSRAFCSLAAGTYFQAAHNNGQPLVEEFRHLISLSTYRFSGNETEFPHLVQQLMYLGELLPENDPWHDRHLLQHFIAQLKDDPMDVFAQDLVTLILRNFASIGNSSHTYRALMDISSIAAPSLPDTPALRIAYIDTLDKISREW